MESFIVLVKYAFLGILQGITEPIPVSSSGHLVIVQKLFGIGTNEDMSFEILMNFASLLAVLLLFKKDILSLAKGSIDYIVTRRDEKKASFLFVFYLIIATVPAGVVGILFEDEIAETFKDLHYLAGALFITGFALWMIRNLKGRKGEKNISITDALVVGVAQSFALIPGISRSGATIVAALGIGMKRETAFLFSFLLYIPVSLGTAILSFKDFQVNELLIPNTIAFILSFIFSYISLKWFKGIVERGNLKYFAYYCFALSILLFIIT
ncbi:undecaprenyl-diphosphate phosphatase [Fervidibacillus halotolerans]|uniref:Undecaprenyl-diphosphatase n=1 Tax=Fervidibacillus halotolerans TaxID=2980027 RepID=A0A9E8RZ34_9BACI|nr:undecaprenyl-diphosphate phosphatase [Fervidibacillus halotolerans]WAA13486.1 UDP pyrophosphate phosphatase [Fervidibacillus halotolerans]